MPPALQRASVRLSYWWGCSNAGSAQDRIVLASSIYRGCLDLKLPWLAMQAEILRCCGWSQDQDFVTNHARLSTRLVGNELPQALLMVADCYMHDPSPEKLGMAILCLEAIPKTPQDVALYIEAQWQLFIVKSRQTRPPFLSDDFNTVNDEGLRAMPDPESYRVCVLRLLDRIIKRHNDSIAALCRVWIIIQSPAQDRRELQHYLTIARSESFLWPSIVCLLQALVSSCEQDHPERLASFATLVKDICNDVITQSRVDCSINDHDQLTMCMAHSYLGYLFDKGITVRSDYKIAIKHYRQALDILQLLKERKPFEMYEARLKLTEGALLNSLCSMLLRALNQVDQLSDEMRRQRVRNSYRDAISNHLKKAISALEGSTEIPGCTETLWIAKYNLAMLLSRGIQEGDADHAFAMLKELQDASPSDRDLVDLAVEVYALIAHGGRIYGSLTPFSTLIAATLVDTDTPAEITQALQRLDLASDYLEAMRDKMVRAERRPANFFKIELTLVSCALQQALTCKYGTTRLYESFEGTFTACGQYEPRLVVIMLLLSDKTVAEKKRLLKRQVQNYSTQWSCLPLLEQHFDIFQEILRSHPRVGMILCYTYNTRQLRELLTLLCQQFGSRPAADAESLPSAASSQSLVMACAAAQPDAPLQAEKLDDSSLRDGVDVDLPSDDTVPVEEAVTTVEDCTAISRLFPQLQRILAGRSLSDDQIKRAVNHMCRAGLTVSLVPGAGSRIRLESGTGPALTFHALHGRDARGPRATHDLRERMLEMAAGAAAAAAGETRGAMLPAFAVAVAAATQSASSASPSGPSGVPTKQ